MAKLTPAQSDMYGLTHGPRGGLLRGKRRHTIKQAEKALAHWSKDERAWVIFWLILYGRVR